MQGRLPQIVENPSSIWSSTTATGSVNDAAPRSRGRTPQTGRLHSRGSQHSDRTGESSRGHSRSGSPSRPGTVSSEMSRVTKEDVHNAMLGYVDLNMSVSADGDVFYREEFCGACGIIHSRPELLDIYISCKSCHSVLRQPSSLRKSLEGVKMKHPLEVLCATYGDPIDPDYAVDVTQRCEELVSGFSSHDRIAFKPALPADQVFGVDPRPGHNKQLRLRYRSDSIHGTLTLDFDINNKIPVPYLFLVPRTRYLKIHHAIYGHPKGATSTGRMSFDVLELVQSLVDQNGGSYLSISSYTPLTRIFGDPCPGEPYVFFVYTHEQQITNILSVTLSLLEFIT